MLRSVIGSVRPRSRPITGVRNDGRNPSIATSFDHGSRAPLSRANQPTARRLNTSGAWLSASAPPARIRSDRPFLDVAIGGVDRLHAGAAIDLHGEGGHRFAHAEPQRGDARRVHLVGDHVDAAEDDLVERVRRERLAQQQRPAALHREIDRRERAGLAARLDERRAAAVDDVDRAPRYSAAAGRAAMR